MHDAFGPLVSTLQQVQLSTKLSSVLDCSGPWELLVSRLVRSLASDCIFHLAAKVIPAACRRGNGTPPHDSCCTRPVHGLWSALTTSHLSQLTTLLQACMHMHASVHRCAAFLCCVFDRPIVSPCSQVNPLSFLVSLLVHDTTVFDGVSIVEKPPSEVMCR